MREKWFKLRGKCDENKNAALQDSCLCIAGCLVLNREGVVEKK